MWRSRTTAAAGSAELARTVRPYLYLNLFVLLLAPSSLYRKSTCVAIAQDCARSIEGRPEREEEALPGSEKILYPNQFTPESLLDILKDQPSGLLTIDEFRMFLDSLRRDYNSGLRQAELRLSSYFRTY